MNFLLRVLYTPVHWLAHLIKENQGRVISWTDRDRVFVAFQCAHCGKIDGVQSITSPKEIDATETVEDN